MLKLPAEQFHEVVRRTPLVALDLLLISADKKVILGWRKHPPARNFLFVPGGRVFKGERLSAALTRIAREELGHIVDPTLARLHGVFEHFYSDNAFGEPDTPTHYIVMACVLAAPAGEVRSDEQHRGFIRLSRSELLSHPHVHTYTRNYFIDSPDNQFFARTPTGLQEAFASQCG